MIISNNCKEILINSRYIKSFNIEYLKSFNLPIYVLYTTELYPNIPFSIQPQPSFITRKKCYH